MTEIIFDEQEDWDKRILCSDGACIGVIGPDGKCKECGKPYEGVLPEGHGQPTQQPAAEEEAVAAVPEAEDEDWDKRILCSDGACIGVIGPDGKCKECGKPPA
ncbi:MAG: hypothetical protein PHG54_01955 [Smithellaceae bacterium]|nr:hypothetical protein [Syntrophaceae bacterium]MDD4240167.1 hypothetical protein [Smithellaceae bacterium]NLX51367.1 hypothetical protein [Deltaproteobacteria bacterium]